MHEAMFYRRLAREEVVCDLCCHRCHIGPGKRGICGVRQNQGGRLESLVYGLLVSGNADPIEKKPLYHFLPGSRSYSIATVGCNLQCLHCQNYQISQYPRAHNGQVAGSSCSAEQVVAEAQRTGCLSISYTYVEPTIFYEFAYDCACLAREAGLRNVFVSNGYMTTEVIEHLAPVLDGINIDLKAHDDAFYRRVCKARLQPVLDAIARFHALGVWVEVTTLLIPGLNDSDEMLTRSARFLRQLSPDIPWHVTAFRPTYQMLDRPPTPETTLKRARTIGQSQGLNHVYEGNLVAERDNGTRCPHCAALLIERQGHSSRLVALKQGRCTECGQAIAGHWGG